MSRLALTCPCCAAGCGVHPSPFHLWKGEGPGVRDGRHAAHTDISLHVITCANRERITELRALPSTPTLSLPERGRAREQWWANAHHIELWGVPLSSATRRIVPPVVTGGRSFSAKNFASAISIFGGFSSTRRQVCA